jgi:hypothetical protein
MTPEQLQGKETDGRSDLFSFGCVLYEMLTGKRAFEGASAPSVIAAVLEREPSPLEVSPPLARVVKSCLAKDPDQRIQTARDVKTALEWATEPAAASAPRTNRRGQWIAATALLAIGTLSGWMVAHFRQPSSTDRVLRLDINPPEGGRFVTLSNTVGGSALSPDGRMAAFVAAINGKTGLWVRALDNRTARLLPGTEGAWDPFWSPDSKSIAFWAGGKLQRTDLGTDLAGGPPVTICDGFSARGALERRRTNRFWLYCRGTFSSLRLRLGGNALALDARRRFPRRDGSPIPADSARRPLPLLGASRQA